VRTHRGRADVVIQTDSTVLVFEFKLHGTKESALTQIKENEYHVKYLGRGKPIHFIGVEFSREQRNIGEWVVERMS
jgi:hypothetical protein